MSSRPPPDFYCKFKANTSSITLKTGNKRKKFKASTLYWHCIKNFKYLGGWAGKSAMADATKTTARHIGHMTYTQAPAVYEKNIFHLFRFTQPVKNYSSHTPLVAMSSRPPQRTKYRVTKNLKPNRRNKFIQHFLTYRYCPMSLIRMSEQDRDDTPLSKLNNCRENAKHIVTSPDPTLDQSLTRT